MVYKMKDSLNIDRETRIIYKRIQNECSDFRLTNLDIFKLALAIGYNHSIRAPLSKKERFIRLGNVSDDFYSLIWLIIIDEFGNDFPNFVENPSIAYEIAEEYANAGIMIIHDMFNKEFDFYLILEKELSRVYEESNLIDDLDEIKLFS